MAKRRRGTKAGDLLLLLWVMVLGVLGYPPHEHLVAWIVLVPAVGLLWFAFLMPTKCAHRPCGRGVRGKLRNCRDHARWKRDAMLARHRAS